MISKALAFCAAALCHTTFAQTQEEVEAYPEYATNFAKWGMTWESMKVQTDDGYTLTMFHITGTVDGGNIAITKPAVIFQHGMGGNALGWTTSLNPDKVPMAIQIAKMGFDVYMPNNSGVQYS